MLKALQELGQANKKTGTKAHIFQKFDIYKVISKPIEELCAEDSNIENNKKTKSKKKKPKIEKVTTVLKYLGINIENNSYSFIEGELSDDSYLNFLYRKISSNGVNITPTILCSEKHIEDSFQRKILKWFSNVLSNEDIIKELSLQEIDFLKQIQKVLGDKTIVNELKKYNENELIRTLTIFIDGQPLISYPIFYKIALLTFEKMRNLSQVESPETCFLCNQTSQTVKAGYLAFKKLKDLNLFTGDKPSLLASSKEEAWKDCPICDDCNEDLEIAVDMLTSLEFSFCGNKYYLIPKLLFGKTDCLTKSQGVEQTEDFFDAISFLNTNNCMSFIDDFENAQKQQRLDKNTKVNYIDMLDNLIAKANNCNELLTLTLLFATTKTNANRIDFMMNDIIPSNLAHLFKAMEEIYIDYGVLINFYNLKLIFPKYIEKQMLLDTMRNIFTNTPMHRETIENYILSYIRKNLDNEQTHFVSKNLFYLLEMLKRMNLIF